MKLSFIQFQRRIRIGAQPLNPFLDASSSLRRRKICVPINNIPITQIAKTARGPSIGILYGGQHNGERAHGRSRVVEFQLRGSETVGQGARRGVTADHSRNRSIDAAVVGPGHAEIGGFVTQESGRSSCRFERLLGIRQLRARQLRGTARRAAGKRLHIGELGLLQLFLGNLDSGDRGEFCLLGALSAGRIVGGSAPRVMQRLVHDARPGPRNLHDRVLGFLRRNVFDYFGRR
jgi:hypothetical protein